MLCDSIGLDPMPNNGTLRLPLKPSGQHQEEDTPPVPEDPEPTVEYTSATATPEAPVTVTVTREHTKATEPSATPSDTSDDDNSHPESNIFDAVKGAWDWVTDKIHGVWDGVTGSKPDKDGGKDSNEG